MFMMSHNNDGRKKSAFPPYVTLYDETKRRSSAAATSEWPKQEVTALFELHTNYKSLLTRVWLFSVH